MFQVFLLVGFYFFFSPQKASAACPLVISPKQEYFPYNFSGKITVISLGGVAPVRCFNEQGGKYIVVLRSQKDPEIVVLIQETRVKVEDSTTLSFNVDLREKIPIGGGQIGPGGETSHPDMIEPGLTSGSWTITVCTPGDFRNCKPGGTTALGFVQIQVSPAPPPTPTPVPANLPKIDNSSLSSCLYQTGDKVKFNVTNIQPNKTYVWWWHGDIGIKPQKYSSSDPAKDLTVEIPSDETQQVGVRIFCIDFLDNRRCSRGFQNSVMLEFTPTPPDEESKKRSCGILNTIPISYPPSLEGAGLPCNGSRSLDGKCEQVDTAVGPIPTDPAKFVGSILKIFLGLAGGIALLLIIVSGYQLMTSQGNPEKIQEAKERLTSAIVGLLFIIFSLVLLETVGVDILQIPGFSK